MFPCVCADRNIYVNVCTEIYNLQIPHANAYELKKDTQVNKEDDEGTDSRLTPGS